MAIVGELLVLIGANGTPLTAALGKAEGEIKGFGATGGGALTAVRVAGAAMAAGVGLYLGEAAHAAIGFQDKLVDVGVTAHLTSAEAAAIGTAVQASAIGTTASGTEMLKALAPVAGELQRVAGGHLDAKAAVETLRAAEELAVSSNSDLGTSMKSITDLLLTYHLKASASADVSSLLFAAHSQLGVAVDTLGAQLQKLQPRVAGTGVDLKTMLGIAREMEPTVGTGQRAVMTLGSVLQQFMAPTKAATGVLSDLHVKLTDTHGKFIGFGPAIDLLHNKLANLTPAQRAADLHALFGKNTAIATVLINGGAKALDANKAALDKQGTAAAAAAARSADLAHQGEIIHKSIETMTEAIGGVLLPMLNRMMSAILPVVTSVTAWAQANPQLVTQILLVVGAVGALAAGGLVLDGILGGIATVIGVLTSPIVLIVGAIAALAAHFGLFGDSAKGAIDGLIPATGPLRDVFNAITAGISTLATALGPLISAVIPVVNAFGSIIAVIASGDDVMAGLHETIGNLGEKFGALLPVIGQTLGQLGSTIVGWIAAQAPGWAAQLGKWAAAFIGWIAPMIGPALAMLGQLTGQLFAWVSAQVPGWIAQLGKWAGAFVGWIGPMIQPALIALGELMSAGLKWVSAQLPVWGVALLKWVTAFLGWILPMIPPLLLELGKLILAIDAWVIQQIPVLVGAFLGLGKALVDWIDKSMPEVRAGLGRFLASIIAWFGSIIPQITKAAGSIGKGIADGIMAGLGDIGKGIAEKIQSIPGVGLIGDISKNASGIKLPGFATGGVVPGTGPQLIVAHGGEQILNQGQQGRGGGPMVAHITVNVGGQQIGEVIETLLFNSASGASSGFAGSSVTD